MGSTEVPGLAALVSHASGLATKPARLSGVGGGRILGGLNGSLRPQAKVLPHAARSIFSDLNPTALADAITKSLVSGFFHSLLGWVSDGAASLVGVLGNALSSSTAPVLSSSAFGSEFGLMVMLSGAVALPLVAVGAIQSIACQEPSTLLRSVLIRLPLALLFTGVSVQVVALGLTATDQASAVLIGADGDPAHQLLTGLVSALSQPAVLGLAAFAEFLLVLSAGLIAFLLWLELAVRGAAISAASLFLPIALVGLAWPATAHWARRLGETLTALVLSKLVIAAVLALAAGLLVGGSGLAAIVQGVALLAMAAFAPFALLKLVPVIEAGAVAHLEGLGRRSLRAVEQVGTEAFGLEGGGVAALAALGGAMTRGVQSISASSGTGSDAATTAAGAGPWTDSRPAPGASSPSTSPALAPAPAGPQATGTFPPTETAQTATTAAPVVDGPAGVATGLSSQPGASRRKDTEATIFRPRDEQGGQHSG